MGDRLEPTETFPDVGQFKEMTVFPVQVLFWRPSMESICRHRSPLWCPEIGITPVDSIVFDVLHTLYLGMMLVWAKRVMWFLFNSKVWGNLESTDEEQLIVSVHALRAELMSWYTARAQQHHQEQLSKLADLTINMVGTPADPKLKLKAAEAYGFTLFLCDILCKVLDKVPSNGRGLLEAGQCLARIVHIMTSQGVRLSTASRQDPWGAHVARGVFVRLCRFLTAAIPLFPSTGTSLSLWTLFPETAFEQHIYIYNS
jgi:hypothetical protein